jgi:hypothetical protein
MGQELGMMLGFAGLLQPWSAWRPDLRGPLLFKPVEAVSEAPAESDEGTKARLEVRRVTTLAAAELWEAAALLARSFDHSTLFQAAFPEAEARGRILHALFTTILKDALRFGRVDIACNGQIVGAVVWYPLGCYPMSALRILRLLPEYLRIVAASPLGVLKLWRAQATLNRHRPREPHCHGYFLCARPGNHVGVTLIKRVLKEVDDCGQPMYLETQEGRSPNLYGRFGFRMMQDGFETVPGGPLTWTMWREPQKKDADKKR